MLTEYFTTEITKDCRDAGGRAPTVGALGGIGAVAEEQISTCAVVCDLCVFMKYQG
jgi:hypothetical protein